MVCGTSRRRDYWTRAPPKSSPPIASAALLCSLFTVAVEAKPIKDMRQGLGRAATGFLTTLEKMDDTLEGDRCGQRPFEKGEIRCKTLYLSCWGLWSSS